MESITSSNEAILADNLKELSVQDPSQPLGSSQEIPPHRSHDPENNLKRSDPFQFGSRYLNENDNVFEFNAWDHVETDDIYKEYAEQQYAKQREAPVSEFDKSRFNSDPAKWWNNFYKNNTANFFKDRKWLQQEFPILSQITKADAGPITLLEVGAGAGNTAFPILAHNQNPDLKIHACDFSKKAVEVIRSNEAYGTKNIQADVWDVAENNLPPGMEEGSADLVLMIFIFSALSPSQWNQAVQNIFKVLKPGGEVLFRDYGRGDLAQVRFKKGRYLEENFYIRGDGTRVYFFEKDELVDIWTKKNAGDVLAETTPEPHFEVIDLGVDRRLLVNRAKQLKMYRCWLQGRFRKQGKTNS
ncbi:hypothetical protein G7Y89_g6395 [Cudoniella acicularis]|uniref:tRNA N(3)-methylcytidine methyltransferase n=1 Tax=Cudoniella acicularis TaxID=354080 RepID=A0A8H4RMS1_9HELO|nr:hypothetical protein G7Y89_g6395 [Cudoniella acicularis]